MMTTPASIQWLVSVNVLWIFLTVPWVCLQCVIVFLPNHARLLSSPSLTTVSHHSLTFIYRLCNDHYLVSIQSRATIGPPTKRHLETPFRWRFAVEPIVALYHMLTVIIGHLHTVSAMYVYSPCRSPWINL